MTRPFQDEVKVWRIGSTIGFNEFRVVVARSSSLSHCSFQLCFSWEPYPAFGLEGFRSSGA
jgi:hypothetical protein